MFNSTQIRCDFPILSKKINGKPLVYLDSTATALKPKAVINAINGYYQEYTANVFRGIYSISEKATLKYETARSQIAELIGCKKTAEIIFTRNASESLNLVYYTWALNHISEGDEVVTSIMEHHSNFVPWQQLQEKKACKLNIWNISKNGLLNYSDLETLITRRTKLLAITSMSNMVGTIVDIQSVVKIVKRINPDCIVLVDAAQTVPHAPVDVNTWGADFVAFSGHKMLGPTGIGVLWGKQELLEEMPPFMFGGDMISEVHKDKTLWNKLPHKFEAGTPHVAGAIGMGAAAKYLMDIGMTNIREHEKEITAYAISSLKKVGGVTIYGPENASDKGGIVSFTLKGIHPHDVAQILDEDNVCVRVGFHCAQPLHEYLGSGPTIRASFYIYTIKEDIDALVDGLEKVKKVFK
jgi:cysteine desulfurase / selenocysteine lyase